MKLKTLNGETQTLDRLMCRRGNICVAQAGFRTMRRENLTNALTVYSSNVLHKEMHNLMFYKLMFYKNPKM